MDYKSGLFLSVADPVGLCSMSAEGDDVGGAAAALAAAGGGGGGEDDAAAAAAGASAGGGGDAAWLEQFSADGGSADNPSNRDWLKSKGFKTLDDIAQSYRETEKAFHTKGGGLVVPGEDAKPEEVEAFHKAIGRPDAPDKYEFKLPDGVDQDALDMDLITPLREAAFKAGVPAAGFAALAETVIQRQLDEMQAAKTAEDGSRDELFKEWGAQKDAKLADVNNAARALGLTAVDVAAIQRGFAMQYGEPGSRRTLELLQKLGAGMAEDVLLNPQETKRRFGLTGAEAQKEIDQLIVDTEFQAKLTSKDPAAVARWDRLNEAVAADRDRQARAAAAG